MFEGDVEQAWVEAGGCSPKRERGHPTAAIPIFQEEVEWMIGAKHSDACQDAVELMAHIGHVMRAAAQPEAFLPFAAGGDQCSRGGRSARRETSCSTSSGGDHPA
jgi:hypothetical protein